MELRPETWRIGVRRTPLPGDNHSRASLDLMGHGFSCTANGAAICLGDLARLPSLEETNGRSGKRRWTSVGLRLPADNIGPFEKSEQMLVLELQRASAALFGETLPEFAIWDTWNSAICGSEAESHRRLDVRFAGARCGDIPETTVVINGHGPLQVGVLLKIPVLAWQQETIAIAADLTYHCPEACVVSRCCAPVLFCHRLRISTDTQALGPDGETRDLSPRKQPRLAPTSAADGQSD